MRLLVVNPNTSQGVTRRIADAAHVAAEPGDSFTVLPAAFGPDLIVTPEDGAEAARGVVQTIDGQATHPDGIVLASFGDTGAPEVRAKWPTTPVIGIAQAAFAATRDLGGPFAIVTFAPEVAGPLQDKAMEHGVGDALLEVAALQHPWRGDPGQIVDALFAPLADLCLTCVRAGAMGIVMGGGPLAGFASRFGSECPVPLIDGTEEAIHQMRRHLGSA